MEETDIRPLLDKLDELTRERDEAIAQRDKAIADLGTNRYAEAAKLLVARVHGDTGRCKGCLKEIYWVRHREGAIAPYNRDGTMHNTTCPHANEFRRGPRQQSFSAPRPGMKQIVRMDEPGEVIRAEPMTADEMQAAFDFTGYR